MTTIAANLEFVAADKRMTGVNMGTVRKLRRIKDSLYGGAGDLEFLLIFYEWLEQPKPDRLRLYRHIPEDFRSSIEVLELSPTGLALWSGWGARIPLQDKFYAIGSGCQFAMQSMAHGVSPMDAVVAAMKMDEATGGEVEYEPLALPPELKRKRRG